MYDYERELYKDIWDTLDDHIDIFKEYIGQGNLAYDAIHAELLSRYSRSPIVEDSYHNKVPQVEIEQRFVGNWDLMLDALTANGLEICEPEAVDEAIRSYLLPEVMDRVIKDIRIDVWSYVVEHKVQPPMKPWLKDILDEYIEEDDEDDE